MITGLAIVFNTPSVDLGGFREIILPEAIRRTFEEKIDLRAFIDHDPGKILGRLTAGTLRAAAAPDGLNVEIDPPKRTDAANLMESIDRGDVTGMSFGFQTLADDWKNVGGQIVRYVGDMRVFEVSVVSMPAYDATSVEIQRHVEIARRGFLAFRQTIAPPLAHYRARMAAQAARFEREVSPMR